ncbi:MAG: ABC transporter permease [Segetibacter sp.]
MGKQLLFDNKKLYAVTGVIKDIPENSHFHYDFFISLAGDPYSREDNWLSFNFNTYLLLRQGTDPKVIQAKFDEILKNICFPGREHNACFCR